MDYTKTFGAGDNLIELTVLEQSMGRGLIGLLTSKLFENPLGLVQSEAPKPDEEVSIAALGVLPEEHFIVQMQERFIDALRHSDITAEMILLHEIGHYVHGDYKQKSVQGRDAERAAAFEQGDVLQIELQADSFAAEYLGAEKAALALDDLKNFMLQEYGGKWDKSSLNIAAREIERRIVHLSNRGCNYEDADCN